MKLLVIISEVGSSYSLNQDLVHQTLEELKKVLKTDNLTVSYTLKEAGVYAPNQEKRLTLPDSCTDVTVLLQCEKALTNPNNVKQKIVDLLVKLITSSNTSNDLFLDRDGKPMITTSIAINKGKPTLFLDVAPLPTPKS